GEDRVPDGADLRRAAQEGLPGALGRDGRSARHDPGRAPAAAEGGPRRDHGVAQVAVMRRRSPRLLAASAALLLLAAAPTPEPTAAPTNSCAACKERQPTLDPAQFQNAEKGVQQGYEVARKYPATLDRLHCFCECAESPMFHHKTLLTCFTSTHAAGCGICLSEARLAADLKEKGLSDDEIKNTVESVHRTDGHSPTH